MGFVSDVLDKVDDCAELYNFLFVDYKIDQIDREMDYLNKICNHPKLIRDYFLGYASQISMPLQVLYIHTILNADERALAEELEKMYHILAVRKSQIAQNRIATEPIKLASNFCRAVEEEKAGR